MRLHGIIVLILDGNSEITIILDGNSEITMHIKCAIYVIWYV